MGVSEIRRPTVGLLMPGRAKLPSLRTEGEQEHLAWVVPGHDEIQIMIRPVPEQSPPEPIPIPHSGPWRLPDPIPPWAPPKKVEVEFPDGLDCPRCGRVGSTYRQIAGGFLVCPSCRCSFEQ